MGNFVLALAIIFGGWWLMRAFASSQPAKIRGLSRKIAGGAMIAAGGFLMLRGAMNVGLPLMMLGAGMMGQTALFPDGFKWPGNPGQAQEPGRQPPTAPSAAMSRDEAYAVLGLKRGATVEDVRAAHRRLMKDFHPDIGGSDYLAAKINRAKDILVQELGATT